MNQDIKEHNDNQNEANKDVVTEERYDRTVIWREL